MTSPLITTLLLCAVSACVFALGRFVKTLSRLCGVLGLVWLAASLPIMFFLDLDADHVLLFYLVSAACGLISHLGGKPA